MQVEETERQIEAYKTREAELTSSVAARTAEVEQERKKAEEEVLYVPYFIFQCQS